MIYNNIKNKECKDILNGVNNDNRIFDILEKYKQHPSIQKIRENVTNRVFSFNNISINEIEDSIRNIDIKKASSDDDIPAKIIIGCSDIVSPFIRQSFIKLRISNTSQISIKKMRGLKKNISVQSAFYL